MRPLWRLRQADIALPVRDPVAPVLKQLTLDIAEGEFLAVVGGNGSGKSTLLRALAGFADIVGGQLESEAAKARGYRFVFQHPDAQLIGETVFEDMAFGLETIGVPEEEMEPRIQAALRAVGLSVSLDRPVERLSGGQKQLLCIAGALAARVRILLLDEPAAMLDPLSRLAVQQAARQLHRDGGTIVWVTQDMEEVVPADRVVVLRDGGIAYDGTPEHFLYGDEDPTDDVRLGVSPCERLGFRLPYAAAVGRRLLAAGYPLRGKPLSEDELRKSVTIWR